MGKLIVDGNMVYEIDEECLRRTPPAKECGVFQELERQRLREAGHPAEETRKKA